MKQNNRSSKIVLKERLVNRIAAIAANGLVLTKSDLQDLVAGGVR